MPSYVIGLNTEHNSKDLYWEPTFNSTNLAKKELKATMHPYDFTVRPQLVEKDWNFSYYRVIKEFENLTGIGGVLNTSFNLMGYQWLWGQKRQCMHLKIQGKYLAN